MPLSDTELVARVTKAATGDITPERVEDAVGERAWINTTRPNDRLALRMADISSDDPANRLPSLHAAREVVYWGRPIRSVNPRIVGIAWPVNGPAEIFFGVLSPP